VPNTVQCCTDHSPLSRSELSEVLEKSPCTRTELIAAIVSFSYINVSQGSVATQLRYGGLFNNPFVVNFPQSVSVK